MIEKLVAYLKECDDAYYNTENVLVSNDTYDALVQTLRRLDPNHPYLKKVGASVREDSIKVGRVVPMGTLSKYHTNDNVIEWLTQESGAVLLAPKYDGFGIELVYDKEGSLVMASTRGSGMVGEDVLDAVMRIKNVPIHLPEEFRGLERVRGEAIIPRVHHEEVKKLGYSAMRNAVPGIVRSNRHDALMFVDFVAYEFFDGDTDRYRQRMKYANLFTVEDYALYNNKEFDAILSQRNSYGDMKDSYTYEIDGVVLKSLDIKPDDLSCPKHQIAWKFPSKYKETVLRGIEFNVGATGAISVVGIFDEVEFQGAMLKRASFGSLALYEEMQPAVGDLVEVSRRGDIIPWIENISQKNSDDYLKLDKCPCCGTPLVDYRCPNKLCSERVKLKLYQYVKYIGVKGIGYALLVALVDNGIIKNLSDIYTLNTEDIVKLPRQGRSSADKWKTLQEKEVSALDLLCAYPFENAGKSVWKPMLDRFSLIDILNMDKSTLESANIKGLGSVKIESIITQMDDAREEITSLAHRLNLV